MGGHRQLKQISSFSCLGWSKYLFYVLILHSIYDPLFYSLDEAIDVKRSLQQYIGDSQYDLEQFQASLVSYHKALELMGQTSGDQYSKNEKKGHIMHNMGMSNKTLNRLEEAIKCFNHSLECKQKMPDSPAKQRDIASTLNCIGLCYQNLGEYQKALDECYEKAREQLQRTKNDHDTKELLSMLLNNEGLCHDELGHHEKALDAYEKDLAIQKEINASAEVLAGTLNNIGTVLSEQGKHQEALAKYKESLVKYKEHSGQDANTDGIARCLNNIGNEYGYLKKFQDSGKWYQEALAMNKKIYSGNHPEVARALNNLGCNYSDQGDLQKAKEHHQKANDMIMACEGHDDLKKKCKGDLDKIEKMHLE